DGGLEAAVERLLVEVVIGPVAGGGAGGEMSGKNGSAGECRAGPFEAGIGSAAVVGHVVFDGEHAGRGRMKNHRALDTGIGRVIDDWHAIDLQALRAAGVEIERVI